VTILKNSRHKKTSSSFTSGQEALHINTKTETPNTPYTFGYQSICQYAHTNPIQKNASSYPIAFLGIGISVSLA
ncbi:hypothetical protein SB763_32920, partial [Burkholderia sp. SIMBA_042]|uniref:hypothetical protein n=1 Tax=Burkholderia sp. SIMBA_042 TaxID=3085783 RepID=UPI00397E2D0A